MNSLKHCILLIILALELSRPSNKMLCGKKFRAPVCSRSILKINHLLNISLVWWWGNIPFKTLWPSDPIWHHIFESTLVQVMTCYLTESMLTCHQRGQVIFIWGRFCSVTNPPNYIENYWSKISLKSPRGQWIKKLAQIQWSDCPMGHNILQSAVMPCTFNYGGR